MSIGTLEEDSAVIPGVTWFVDQYDWVGLYFGLFALVRSGGSVLGGFVLLRSRPNSKLRARNTLWVFVSGCLKLHRVFSSYAFIPAFVLEDQFH